MPYATGAAASHPPARVVRGGAETGGSGAGHRPGPAAAYARWLDACTGAGWRAAPTAEQVPVADGLGRVTAGPIRARWPAPRSTCAAMDGIALNADSAPGPGAPVDRWQLAASSFIWVDTGDLVPPGLDTVVERERVQAGAGGSVWITGPAPRGLHVRARGEDFTGRQLLLPAGHRLRPSDLAAAAAAGHVTVEAARRPVAVIIPTGNEIRPVGAALRPGEVTDSNSLLLAALATETGAQARVSGVQPDDPDAIAAEVRRGAQAADLVLVIAGSSAGRRDHTAAVIGETGGLAVRGVAVRPGHPVLLGYARVDPPRAAVPVIGVPGYPLAAAVIFELFAAPLLCALQGAQPPDRAWRRVRLGRDWASSPDVEDWVPVSLTPAPAGSDAGAAEAAGDAVVAMPGRRGAGSVSRLMRADAWWPIPLGEAKFARGEYIDVLPVAGAPH